MAAECGATSVRPCRATRPHRRPLFRNPKAGVPSPRRAQRRGGLQRRREDTKKCRDEAQTVGMGARGGHFAHHLCHLERAAGGAVHHPAGLALGLLRPPGASTSRHMCAKTDVACAGYEKATKAIVWLPVLRKAHCVATTLLPDPARLALADLSAIGHELVEDSAATCEGRCVGSWGDAWWVVTDWRWLLLRRDVCWRPASRRPVCRSGKLAGGHRWRRP